MSYPEHSWMPWQFDRVGVGYWSKSEHIYEVVWRLRIDKGWLALGDLYHLTHQDFVDIGGLYLFILLILPSSNRGGGGIYSSVLPFSVQIIGCIAVTRPLSRTRMAPLEVCKSSSTLVGIP